VFVLMTALMLAVGLLASYVPARRASAVNPIESLRND
jgi:ABC-type antimicrobial peptide transport system permease subunit